MGPALASSPRTLLLLIAVLILVGGGLRLLAAERARPLQLRGDEWYYLSVAQEISAGRGHVRPSPWDEHARRPPAFPWLLSLFTDRHGSAPEDDLRRLGEELLPVQLVLGTALVVITFLLGRALFDTRVGFLAGLLAAIDPTLVAFSHYFWSETLFSILVTGALIGVVLVRRSGSWVACAAAGLLFGAAALTREVALPIAAACAVWQIATVASGARRKAAARGALMVALAVAVVLPWTWRNYNVMHRLVPVSTIGWFASAEGNTLDPAGWFHGTTEPTAFRAAYRTAGDEMQRTDFARRYALERIAAEQPAWIFKKLLRNTALLLTPDSYLLLKLREGFYGPVPLAQARIVVVATVLLFVLAFVLGVIGIASAEGADRRWLPLLLFGVVLAIHVLSNSVSRFRLPWMPLLLVYASAASLDLPRSLRRMGWKAWAVAGAVLIYFLAVCVPYDQEILARIWNGG
jgi:4-amino-4-deoxy-L-arabinose transferase-like glycosyltransferase